MFYLHRTTLQKFARCGILIVVIFFINVYLMLLVLSPRQKNP